MKLQILQFAIIVYNFSFQETMSVFSDHFKPIKLDYPKPLLACAQSFLVIHYFQGWLSWKKLTNCFAMWFWINDRMDPICLAYILQQQSPA